MTRKITTDEKHRIRKQVLFIKKFNKQQQKDGEKTIKFYRHSYKPEIYRAVYEIIKDESDWN